MTATNLGKVMILPRQAYDPAATYNILDLVTYNGSSFVALKTVTGVAPTLPADNVNWQLSASKGDTGDVTPAATAAAAAALASQNAAQAADADAAAQAATATAQASIATTQAEYSTAGATTATTQAGIAAEQATIATNGANTATAEAAAALASANSAAAAVNAGLTTALGNPTGFQQAGAGAVVRTFQDKMRDGESLFDYFTPAQISDVRSNTGSIDLGAAITAILANFSAAGGGIMEAPPGTYLTTTTIVVPSNVHLIGHGPSSIIKASSVANQVLYIGNATTPYATGIRVSGFNITGSAGTGAEVNNCIFASISDIALDGLTCTEGFYFHNTFGCSFFNLWTNGASISDNCFVCGAAYNANTAVNWYTSNTCACNIRIDASYNGGNRVASGSSFNGLTVQGGNIGLWVRQYQGATISGMYEENSATPIVLGDLTASIYPQGVTIEGVSLSGPNSSHPNYASRYSFIDFQFAKGCEVHGVSFGSPGMETTIAPVSFSGGGGSGAVAVAILTAAGAVHDIVTLYGGLGYTSAPTVSIGGMGTGATATCVLSGSQVGAITVTSGGSGYTPTSCPLAVTYGRTYRCSIYYPSWDAGNGLGSVTYAYVKRSSGAVANCGVDIFGDGSRLYNGLTTPADFRKTQGSSHQHVIMEISPTGAWIGTPFVPGQYP